MGNLQEDKTKVTVNGDLQDSFKEACCACGLLQDDRDWLLYLHETTHFTMSYQLCCLFVIILVHCAPVDPDCLQETSKNNLCNDLNHYLIYALHNSESTQDQDYDYGLYLIAQDLRSHGKSLQDYPSMPRPHGNWVHQEGNQLINEQRAYDRQEQQAFVDRGLPTFNPQQSALYHCYRPI